MTAPVTITVLTVTYNAAEFIGEFLQSVQACDQSGISLDITVVDNGSTDATLSILGSDFPEVRVLPNERNNYAAALNLGIASSSGDYLVIVNNDGRVDTLWLQGLLQTLRQHPDAGVVQSKIFFDGNGLLNSVGVEEIEDFYFRDMAFEQPDSARYRKPAIRQYVTGGSLMFRRQCLEQVGPWDESFIMYMEDVDYSIRCRQSGWTLMFAPDSVFHHRFHGSASSELCDYFCARNRLLLVAKHFPERLADSIRSSHFYEKEQYDLLYSALLLSVLQLCQSSGTSQVAPVLEAIDARMREDFGPVCARHFFRQLELQLGLRPFGLMVLGAQEDPLFAALVEALQQRYPGQLLFSASDACDVDVPVDLLLSVEPQNENAFDALRSLAITDDSKAKGEFDRVLPGAASADEALAVLDEFERQLCGVEILPTSPEEVAE